MNEKINITLADSSAKEVDVICLIENNATKKRYLYYTLNEVVGEGPSSTVKIYVAKMRQNDPALDAPITDEEWDALKGYMGDALKGVSNETIKYLPASEITDPVSVNERAIAMPTSYDYINKQRGIYATSVANSPAPDAIAPAPEVPPMEAPLEPATMTPPVPPMESPVGAQQEQVAAEPAPVGPTLVEGPAVEAPISGAPEPVPAPPIPDTPAQEVSTSDAEGTTLQPIDLSTIEAKYAEMMSTLEKLKEQEIEAAKRYNATLELSAMHNEQHASYVQSEQEKVGIPTEPPITAEPSIMTPPVPPMEPPVGAQQEQVVAEPAPMGPTPEPAPLGGPASVAPGAPEPVPITPITPEPQPASGVNIETNWFDMPQNQ